MSQPCPEPGMRKSRRSSYLTLISFRVRREPSCTQRTTLRATGDRGSLCAGSKSNRNRAVPRPATRLPPTRGSCARSLGPIDARPSPLEREGLWARSQSRSSATHRPTWAEEEPAPPGYALHVLPSLPLGRWPAWGALRKARMMGLWKGAGRWGERYASCVHQRSPSATPSPARRRARHDGHRSSHLPSPVSRTRLPIEYGAPSNRSTRRRRGVS